MRSANGLLFLVAGIALMVACQAGTEESTTPTLLVADELDTAVFSEITATPESATTPAPESETRNGTADANVEHVRAVQAENGTWSFHVTVSHPDTGWEDYADGWDVVTPDGTVIKQNESDPFTRLLLHPHETEQPFTRSQGNLTIPDGITQVTVRAHDLVDGFGGQEVIVDLTAESGPNFEVETN